MKIEDQVCTLEQAKRLKELGIGKQKEGWNVKHVPPTLMVWMEETPAYLDFRWNFNKPEEGYPAYTVAELGVMLPLYYSTWNGNNNMGESSWVTRSLLDDSDKYDTTPMERRETEAACRGAILIHLLETGKITAEQVNTRLFG